MRRTIRNGLLGICSGVVALGSLACGDPLPVGSAGLACKPVRASLVYRDHVRFEDALAAAENWKSKRVPLLVETLNGETWTPFVVISDAATSIESVALERNGEGFLVVSEAEVFWIEVNGAWSRAPAATTSARLRHQSVRQLDGGHFLMPNTDPAGLVVFDRSGSTSTTLSLPGELGTPVFRPVISDAVGGRRAVGWTHLRTDKRIPAPRVGVLESNPLRITDLPALPHDYGFVEAVAIQADGRIIAVVPTTHPGKWRRAYHVLRTTEEGWETLGPPLGEHRAGSSQVDLRLFEGQIHLFTIDPTPVEGSDKTYTPVVRRWDDDGSTWIEMPTRDPGNSYKHSPQLWEHEGSLHLSFIEATEAEVFSAVDVWWGMKRDGNSAAAMRARPTHARKITWQVQQGDHWHTVEQATAEPGETRSSYRHVVLGCPTDG